MPSTKRRKQVSDAVRTRLWPVPMIGVVLAIGGGIGLPALDRVIDDGLPHVRPIYANSFDDARELLGTISTALITVTSLTFSLTLATLRLASGQYSPRLLRTFARDRFVQCTMALFLAMFAYAITVLHNIRYGSARRRCRAAALGQPCRGAGAAQRRSHWFSSWRIWSARSGWKP